MRRGPGWVPVPSTARQRRSAATAVVVLASAALAVADPVDVGAASHGEGVWEQTTPLSVPRYDHTSTLVGGGKVLVAGGRTQGTSPVELPATGEVFDARTERWLPTGPMTDARWSHTATVLPDGRVLVAGGFGRPFTVTASGAGSNSQPVLDTAEIFDPRTGRWSRTASMGTRRALHVAALLPDGKVLVGGGRTCNQPPPAACNFTFVTSTAELYDPATGTWSPTGPLTAPRHTTSPAVLANGTVLVPAGFVGGGAPVATAEVYDPATGTSAPTGNLNVARARQGAMVLHDGSVLVAGGFATPTSELYSPATRTWSLTGDIPVPPGANRRFNHAFAVLPNGKALVAGGATFPPSAITRNADLYDPATRTWVSAGDMHQAHGSSSSLSNSHPAVVLGSNPWRFEARPEACAPNCGKALVAGDNPTGAVELYTPSCPSVLPRPPQQLWCVRDGGPASGRPGAPGTPGEPGPPEWLGSEASADRPRD